MTNVLKIMRSFVLVVTVVLCSSMCAQILAADYNGQVQNLINNAEAYNKQNNYAMALKMYDRAIELTPGDIGLHYRRAVTYGRSGNYMSAIQDLTLVINADEKNQARQYPAARKFRAECYASAGFLHQSAEEYIALLRRDPRSKSSGKIWYYLAEVYAVMQRKDLAVKAIRRGIATGSHWSGKLKKLEHQIMAGRKISLHPPFSN